MIYDIISRRDFQAGATLVLKMPEEDLDRKAFYTAIASPPDFLLPFRYIITEGKVELTYQLGKNVRLLNLSDCLSPKEYADLFSIMLTPLHEYDNWFLDPYSFVLDIEYIYFDNDENAVKYLYIPSKRPVSDLSSLTAMVSSLTERFSASDTSFEIKVLKAIKKDFDIRDFLSMLAPYRTVDEQIESGDTKMDLSTEMPNEALRNRDCEVSSADYMNSAVDLREIRSIAIKTEHVKQPKPKKEKRKFFGRSKKDEPKNIILGAATEYADAILIKPQHTESSLSTPNLTPLTRVTQSINQNSQENTGAGVPDAEDVTVEFIGFRIVLGRKLPQLIDVNIGVGKKFTIGRFDAIIGKKQSDFEFDKSIKAVSRRHAVVERTLDGYFISDCGSSAGTFVNNRKIVPTLSHPLKCGDRVSFGNAGADYIWENNEYVL